MDELSRGVIFLMKSAITGEKYQLPENFDLEQARIILSKHSVLALGYLGARQCGLDRQSPSMQRLYLDYRQSLYVNEKQTAGIHKIYRAFDEAEIDYMPVKGCNMKFRYPYPELRMMGDADILIRTEQYDRIRRIMQELGFTEGQKYDHELPWSSPDLYVELHRCLIPTYANDYYEYYKDSWRLASRSEGTHFYMKPEDEFLYIFTHMARHYRGGGIGLRQVLDLWVLKRTFPEMDSAYIAGELQKLHLLDFYRNIQRTLEVWFEDRAEDPITELITDYILSSGNWGTVSKHTLSDAVKSMEKGKKFSRLGCVVRMAFPDKEVLKTRYPVVQKYPVLQPLLWVRRWFDVMRTRPEKIRWKLRSVGTLSDENLSDFQKSLHAVGLDFRQYN